jgi:hypothetical protein
LIERRTVADPTLNQVEEGLGCVGIGSSSGPTSPPPRPPVNMQRDGVVATTLFARPPILYRQIAGIPIPSQNLLAPLQRDRGGRRYRQTRFLEGWDFEEIGLEEGVSRSRVVSLLFVGREAGENSHRVGDGLGTGPVDSSMANCTAFASCFWCWGSPEPLWT